MFCFAQGGVPGGILFSMSDQGVRKYVITSELGTSLVFFWIASLLSFFVWLFSRPLVLYGLELFGYTIRDERFLAHLRVLFVSFTILVLFLCAYIFALHVFLSKKRKVGASVSAETINDLMFSREQFRKLYENSPVPYFLMDDVGNIRNPNRAALRFFGGTLEECGTTNFYALLSEKENAQEKIDLLRAKVERAIPVTQEEMCIQTLNNSTRFGLVSIYSLDRKSTIPFKHLVTLVDVSEEKESERVKTDFLLLASHQLRTPLTTIKWYIDYLFSAENLEMPKIVHEYLEQIYIGNERMIELMSTLLTISKIEMGTLTPRYEKVHIEEVIQDIFDEIATDVKKKGIRITSQTKGDDLLTTDKAMVRIVIHNLLTNAVKYTPGGGMVTVQTNYGAHKAELSVSDSGCGIPPQEQEKIFTKMFRASNARKVSTNGTGLGLYMSRSFVQKLGGELSFTSTEGKGTTFTITVPRVAPDA